MDTRIEELNENERVWLQEQCAAARAFVNKWSPGDGSQAFCSAGLDRAWAAWMNAHNIDQGKPNDAINAIGNAFGQMLRAATGLQWVIATDDNGSELALHSPAGNVLVYPTDVVAKRWEQRLSGFFETVFPEMLRDVRAGMEGSHSA